MATIETRTNTNGTKSYRAVVKFKGSRFTKTFKRKTDATEWAKDQEQRLRVTPHLVNKKADNHSLSEAIESYRETGLTQMAGNTQHANSSELKWWTENYGTVALSAFNNELLIAAEKKLRKKSFTRLNRQTGVREVRTLSNGSIRRYLFTLSSVFTFAQEQLKWISYNPVRDYKKPKEGKSERYLSDKRGKQGPSELQRLLAALGKNPSPELRLAVNLALCTGARKAEVMGLRWSEIDLDRGVIELVKKRRKTQQAMVYMLPPELVEDLREWQDSPSVNGSPKVFPVNAKKGEGKDKNLTRRWYALLDEAEIYDFRWHDLRHTAGSYLAKAGVGVQVIQRQLGHADIASTMRYAHLDPEHAAKKATVIHDMIKLEGTVESE